MLSVAHHLRGLAPRQVRQWAYAWRPTRARRWRERPGLERVPPANVAVLTLDDGPDPDATPQVLDALDASGSRATFFLVGEQVAAHPELAREIVARGHEIGLHGAGHFRHDRAPAETSRADVVRGLREIEAGTGVRPCWYRPPYGKLSDAAAGACAQLGLEPVYWSAWGLDWERLPAQRIAAAACRGLADGAIVLLHDSARYGRRPSALPTADAISLIAKCARERELRLVTLGEAVGAR